MTITEALLISAGSGLCSALVTIAALKTDISWLKREIERLESGMIRAHERIDQIEKARH